MNLTQSGLLQGVSIRVSKSGSIVTRFLHRLTHRSKAVETILVVTNLTRHTVLTTCAQVADRGDTRRKGLLGHESLCRGDGLWILPCESVHTFGMKFAIDLVYVDRKRRVSKVINNVPPWRISVCLRAHSVLEVAAGTIRETNTEPGDALEFLFLPEVNSAA